MDTVAKLVQLHQVDVAILAESSFLPTELLTTLNPIGSSDYYYAPGILNDRIQVFTKFSAEFISPVFESDKLTIRHLFLPGQESILLATIHFPSKLYWRDESQAFECVELANSISAAEREAGHSRTVLVGDLNMNPFEDGLVSANGLNAAMTRTLANKRSRMVQTKEYPFFYNPMWGLFGDARSTVAGTYYFSAAEHKIFFWNIFDQVLLRPDLLESFDNNELQILHSDGDKSLLTSQGIPDSKNFSDHLPILFKLVL